MDKEGLGIRTERNFLGSIGQRMQCIDDSLLNCTLETCSPINSIIKKRSSAKTAVISGWLCAYPKLFPPRSNIRGFILQGKWNSLMFSIQVIEQIKKQTTIITIKQAPERGRGISIQCCYNILLKTSNFKKKIMRHSKNRKVWPMQRIKKQETETACDPK